MLDSLRSDMLRVLDRDSTTLYSQLHPELSPLAWHVGHALHVEQYWLCEQVLGMPADAAARATYFPEYTPKLARAAQLPDHKRLCTELHDKADRLASAWAAVPEGHAAISSGYLQAFITQHYAQHLETVAMADHAQRIGIHGDVQMLHLDDATPADAVQWQELPGCTVAVGALNDCGTLAPYDNELGAHSVEIEPGLIASRPVSNSQWLGFVADGGYHRQSLWDADGWTWRERGAITAPWGWRVDGARVAVCQPWPDAADLDAPVAGISRHEAMAYARWSGAELPHEHCWLAAWSAGLLDADGIVWEWCSNPLATYPGFVAFPYARYTLPWCDGRHWVLKGGSRMTRPPIRRPHFRNFYAADQRHIFAGVRLSRQH